MTPTFSSVFSAVIAAMMASTSLKMPMKPMSHVLNPLPRVTDTLPRKHINILTYNMFLRPPGIQDDQHDDYKDQRVEEFVKLLPNYDIICLEEVFGSLNHRKTIITKYAKEAGFHYSTDSPSPWPLSGTRQGCIISGGLLILSRFPILASNFQAFPKGINPEGLAYKGVIYAKIQVKDDILHLFHTHQFSSLMGYTGSMLKRAEGFLVWRDFMEKSLKKHKYREGEQCLLLGDFNVPGSGRTMSARDLDVHPALKKYPHLANSRRLSEYSLMSAILTDDNKDELEDIFLKKYGDHPGTLTGIYSGDYGYGGLTLDYIFKFIPKGIVNDLKNQNIEEAEKKGQLKVLGETAKVEKFRVKGFPFTQLSDHYGLSVSLEYEEK